MRFKKFTIQEKELAYRDIVNKDQLKILRVAISKCIEYEKTILEKNYNKQELESYLAHYKISSNVNNLLLNNKLTVSFMKHKYFGNKIIYRLNPKWWKYFEETGISVNKPMNAFFWAVYLVHVSLKEYLKTIIDIKLNIFLMDEIVDNNSALILNVTEDNLIKNDRNKLFNFQTWLMSKEQLKHVKKYYHLETNHKKIVFYSKSRGLKQSAIFSTPLPRILHNYFSIIRSFIPRPLFLLQIMIYPNVFFRYNSLNRDQLAKIKYILVPSSDSWVKPLWLYKAEQFDATVIFINLSSSLVPWQKDQPFYFDWQHLSAWRDIWTASKLQNDIAYKRNLNFINSKFNIVGVPDWVDSIQAFDYNNIEVSIFDIEPHVFNFGQSALNDFGYGNIANALKFLDEIAEVTSSMGVNCFHKPKRIIGDRRYQEYSEKIMHLQKRYDTFHSINALVAPRRLINSSKLVISMPFTSTALIASELKVKNCFYDASKLVDLNDISSEGVLVLNNKHDLAKWLQSNFKN